MTPRVKILAIQAVTLGAIVGGYEWLAHSHIVYEGVVPSVEVLVPALLGAIADPATYGNLWYTALEALGGFAIGTSLGIAIGIVSGAKRWVSAAINPFLDGFATAPKIVFFPIALLICGTGPASKAMLAGLSAVFPVAIAVAAAVRRINPIYVKVGRSFRLSPWQMAAKVYIPALVPGFVNGMRIGLGLAIIGTLLGEIKLSDRGIGFLAIDHYNHFQIPPMYALLILIFVLAVGLNVALGQLEARQRQLRER